MEKALEFIKDRCEKLGITYKDIKDTLKICESHSFRILAGTHLPKNLRGLAELLDVDFEKMICLKYEIPYVEPDTPIGSVSPTMRFNEWRATIKDRAEWKSFDPNI